MKIIYLFLLLISTACSSDSNKGLESIEEVKKDFITTILTESVLDEGPFQMNYHLRAILFSDNLVSLMGDVFVFAHLPHGWIRYEGKTYVKANGSFKEISLNDLFPLLIFQPYAVGGFADGPFIVKIPFTELSGKWQAGNPLEKQLPITKNFLSSWDKDNWISDVQDDHSIVSRSPLRINIYTDGNILKRNFECANEAAKNG